MYIRKSPVMLYISYPLLPPPSLDNTYIPTYIPNPHHKDNIVVPKNIIHTLQKQYGTDPMVANSIINPNKCKSDDVLVM